MSQNAANGPVSENDWLKNEEGMNVRLLDTFEETHLMSSSVPAGQDSDDVSVFKMNARTVLRLKWES